MPHPAPGLLPRAGTAPSRPLGAWVSRDQGRGGEGRAGRWRRGPGRRPLRSSTATPGPAGRAGGAIYSALFRARGAIGRRRVTAPPRPGQSPKVPPLPPTPGGRGWRPRVLCACPGTGTGPGAAPSSPEGPLPPPAPLERGTRGPSLAEPLCRLRALALPARDGGARARCCWGGEQRPRVGLAGPAGRVPEAHFGPCILRQTCRAEKTPVACPCVGQRSDERLAGAAGFRCECDGSWVRGIGDTRHSYLGTSDTRHSWLWCWSNCESVPWHLGTPDTSKRNRQGVARLGPSLGVRATFTESTKLVNTSEVTEHNL